MGGRLWISSNASLANLNGLTNLTIVVGDLDIGNNNSLGNCSALAMLLGWPAGPPGDNVGGSIIIEPSNAVGCNSLQEVLDLVSGPTAPTIFASEAMNRQATLTFSTSTTTDVLWPITGYYAHCLANEQNVFESITPVDIPDEGSVISPLIAYEVFSQNVAGLSIAVDITHPRTRHLTLILDAPDGNSVLLWDESVGDGEDLIGTFPTTLEPAESLDAFDGENFNGEWRLTVADGVATYAGTLNSWGITIRDKVTATSETSPITLNGLADSHPYTCTVSAITGLGIGPASNEVSVAPIPNLIFSNGFESF